MNNNLKFLLLGTSLSLIPTLTHAQCVATTDCATLGYTETSCPNGKGLKCPFGNTFACPASDKSVCEKYGFKYTCTGEGYAGGSGQSCNKQYASCTCSDGYEWKDGKCEKRPGGILGQCTGYAKNCKIGQILNSDGTCSDYRVNGVEPVGVVAYIGTDNCGQALALNSLKKDAINGIAWSREKVDVPGLSNSDAKTDFDSCKNTQTVLDYSYKAYGDSASTYYPAFWNAHDYAPSSISATKGKWCLPAGGVLDSIHKNKDAINLGLTRINAESLGGNHYLWTSSQASSDEAISWQFRWSSLTTTNKLTDRYLGVRFVIEF